MAPSWMAAAAQVVMRPVGDAAGEWQWSGSFPLATREEYLGLRVRAAGAPERAINIPVSTTVGPSGIVLVTFKSRASVPPYRVENACADVAVAIAQVRCRVEV